MFSFFRKHEEVITTKISQRTSRLLGSLGKYQPPSHSELTYISPTIGEKEIVLFLLLIYARMYIICCTAFKDLKDDLNKIVTLPRGINWEQSRFEKTASILIETNFGFDWERTDLDKATKFSLIKWEHHYSINVGKMSTKNPNVYFYCASLLLLEKITDKDKFLDCLIDMGNALTGKTISAKESVIIPLQIVNTRYK